MVERELIPFLGRSKNNRWRMSKKILPPEGRHVLVYFNGEIDVGYHINYAGWLSTRHIRFWAEPTHWKQLPANPYQRRKPK